MLPRARSAPRDDVMSVARVTKTLLPPSAPASIAAAVPDFRSKGYRSRRSHVCVCTRRALPLGNGQTPYIFTRRSCDLLLFQPRAMLFGETKLPGIGVG